MSNKFVLASNNAKKLKEIATILSDFGYEVISQSDAGIHYEVEETGSTFQENALLKAKFAAKESGMPSIADDTGLMVDALDGRPGIYSARYAPNDEERISKLLEELKNVPDEKRTAKFVSAVALAFPDGRTYCVQGEVFGSIASEPRGNGGFGYDPLFVVPQYNKTFGELPQELKNQISHRGQSLEKLKKLIGDL